MAIRAKQPPIHTPRLRGDKISREWVQWYTQDVAVQINSMLNEIVGTTGQIVVTDNGDNTVTLSLDPVNRYRTTTRVTTTPYTILATDEDVYFDTDLISITATLPVGVDGKRVRLLNVGTSGNDVSLFPDGLELLNGVNESEFIADSEKFILTFEETEGWF